MSQNIIVYKKFKADFFKMVKKEKLSEEVELNVFSAADDKKQKYIYVSAKDYSDGCYFDDVIKAIKCYLCKYKKATLHCDRKLLYWIPLDQSVKKIFNNGQIDCVK
jgi:hypothetical protein